MRITGRSDTKTNEKDKKGLCVLLRNFALVENRLL
jgi:hypothetical protein